MATTARPSGSPQRPAGREDESTFTRQLRWEVAGEEGRAIVGSYAIAVTLGVIWLLLVHFLPPTPDAIQLLSAEETAPIDVTYEEPAVPPAPQEGEATVQPAPGPVNRPPGRQGPERG